MPNTSLLIWILDTAGKIRLVDKEYLFQVLSQVLRCIEAFSWENENIVKTVVVSELSTLQPKFILEKVFEWFFTVQPNVSDDQDQGKLIIPFIISKFSRDWRRYLSLFLYYLSLAENLFILSI